MTIGAAQQFFLGASKATGGGGAGYQIERSLRFNSSDSAYLSRTPASAGNRKTWTWSGWVKRANLGSRQMIFGNLDSGGSLGFDVEFIANDSLDIYDYSGGYAARRTTTQVFRDCSSWYHIVIVYDSTNATAADRLCLYVNGSRVTAFANSTDPAPNADGTFNTAVATSIGRSGAYNLLYLSGYLADIHFIDGQALSPSSFTEVSATTGQLIPKAYTGSFGTNGFWLKFSDNSAATATTLGKDYSGNGNNWTPNNLSVTAGAGNDSLVDTPTSYGTDTGAGGEVRGNYCTLNPLTFRGTASLANGNLDYTLPGATGTSNVRGTFALPLSGKWYWEVTITAAGQNEIGVIDNQTFDYSFYWIGGTVYVNSASAGSVSTATANDVIGVGYDADNNQIRWYKNNVQLGSTYSLANTGRLLPYVENGTGVGGATASGTINFGQRPFAYTAPSGFKALCDTNLTAPVIAKPNTVMDVVLYTGTGSALTPTSSLAFNPDWIWIKSRSAATDHALYDVVRGATIDLVSNSTAAETTQTQGLTAFNSNGFSVGTLAKVNTSSATYAAWCWDAGTSTVTNTQGSITSSVRANPSSGFSIVGYTGTGSSGSLGHGLNVKPQLIIVKSRTQARDWLVYHSSYGATQYMTLNGTGAAAATTSAWNNTEPTSTVFTIGNAAEINTNGSTNIAYCFAPVVGYSSSFSYTGNGSTDGVFVYLGFRAKLLLIKRTDTTGNWYLWDTVRNTYNVVGEELYPNLSNAAATATDLDILSNGFKMRSTAADFNASGGTYVGFAISETAFQYSRAR